MDTATVVDLGRYALWMTALGVGLIIGILQAATSINEMTLSFIPKLVALGLAMALFGGWQINTLVEFTRVIFQRIPTLFL
jgi:flagellar biosynthetic protein FliQ